MSNSVLILGGREGVGRVFYQEKVLVRPTEVDVTNGNGYQN